MKTKILATLFFAFFWFIPDACVASVRTSPVERVMSEIRFVISEYKNAHKKTPENWSELFDAFPNAKPMFERARRICDIENRYQLPRLEAIQISDRKERIVVMAKAPGAEGNDPEAASEDLVGGRLLIVEMPDGSLETRRYSEKALKIWFGKANLNLENFTSTMPPAPLRQSGQPGTGEQPGVIDPSAAEAEPSHASNAIHPERREPAAAGAERDELKKSPTATIVIWALLAVALGSVYLVVRRIGAPRR